jgi:hypothetical protein
MPGDLGADHFGFLLPRPPPRPLMLYAFCFLLAMTFRLAGVLRLGTIRGATI